MYPNINAELARHGLTRADFAKHLNVSTSTIKNWLNGKTKIPASKLVDMSHILRCSVDYLLGLNDASHNLFAVDDSAKERRVAQ